MDLDTLHQIILGEKECNAVDRTEVLLEQLAGAIEIDKFAKLYFVIKDEFILMSTMSRARTTFKNHGLAHRTVGGNTMWVGEVCIQFVTLNQYNALKAGGYDYTAFIDITEPGIKKLEMPREYQKNGED